MPLAKDKLALFLFSAISLPAPSLLAQEIAPVPAKTAPEMKPAIEWKRSDYTCEASQKLAIYLHNETVKALFKDKTYLMKQVRSADGAKYSDGKVLWWSVGNGGFLQEDTEDGNGPMIVKDCKLDTPTNATGSNTVTGTVSYLVRMALPPTAVIQVQLQDVSRADAAATVAAEEKITLADRQVPVPFSLTFDPAKINQNHTYSVSARILVDGQLRFISDASYPVITRGNPTEVDVIVKPARHPAPAKP